MSASPALFLDRDGVINVDYAYVHRQDDFHFIDGIFDLCRAARSLGYRIFVITNQAGIGRGYYTEEDFRVLSAWMQAEFEREGAAIDAVYFSPYHPEYGVGVYRKHTNCRKPGPGMLQQAAEEFEVDFARSVLVGDKLSDVRAGLAAGVGCNLLFDPDRKEMQTGDGEGVSTVLCDLREAIPYLKQAVAA